MTTLTKFKRYFHQKTKKKKNNTDRRENTVVLNTSLNLARRQTSKDDPDVLYNGLISQVAQRFRRLGHIALGNASRHPFINSINHDSC